MTKCNIKIVSEIGTDFNQPLKAKAKAYVVDQIRRGLLLPGQHVPSVRHLSKLLDISTNIAFIAIKELREEQILKRQPNGRYLVGTEISRLQPRKTLRIAFTNTGDEQINHSVYQTAFNRLSQWSAADQHITLDCHLNLHDTWSQLPDGYYDFLIVGDWMPPESRRICNGLFIGIDTWKGVDVDCTVKPDHHMGGELVGRFLRKKGRKKILYLDAKEEKPFILQAMVHRRLGLFKGWVDAGGDMEDITYLPTNFSLDQVKYYLKEYLHLIDTIFPYCDAQALHIWSILDEMGMRVPEDVALIGYDGSYKAQTHIPPLTTIKLPYRQAAETIIDLITQGPPDLSHLKGKEILVPPKLFEGGSV